jgi:rRNA pseudouridine-1189 N-methylase Emg1 (Nep1/Mra1 family)
MRTKNKQEIGRTTNHLLSLIPHGTHINVTSNHSSIIACKNEVFKYLHNLVNVLVHIANEMRLQKKIARIVVAMVTLLLSRSLATAGASIQINRFFFCNPILFAMCISTFRKLCKNVYNSM